MAMDIAVGEGKEHNHMASAKNLNEQVEDGIDFVLLIIRKEADTTFGGERTLILCLVREMRYSPLSCHFLIFIWFM